MSLGVIAFVVMAVVFLVVLGAVVAVVFWLIRRSRPGRAGVVAGRGALRGVVRSVVVTTVPRSPARHQDDNDQRRVTVLIDVEGPAGTHRIADGPERPKYLPGPLRWRVFTRDPFRYGDLQLRLDGREERLRAGEQARAGGFEFPVEPPLRVLVVDPGGEGRRPQWRVVTRRSRR